MKLRFIGSLFIVALFACGVSAQPRLPAPTALPSANTVEVSNGPVPPEPIGDNVFAPNPGVYRSFAWVSADYTLSSLTRSAVPPLVTSSPFGVAQADAGVLGRDSTNLLLGQGAVSAGVFNGMRLTTGIRFPAGVMFEVSGFFMLNNATNFNAASDSNNSSTIARPFFEPITGQEAAELVAFPNRFAGSISVQERTTLWGLESNVFEKWNLGIPLIGGVGIRYANLNDGLDIQQQTTALNAPALTFNGNAIPLSDGVRINDSFQTHNYFIGPQILARYDHAFGRFSLGMGAKLAMGSTQQTINIAGQSEHVSASGKVLESANGGFLTTASNIGSFTNAAFSVMPEVNLKIAYNLAPNMSVFVGYDFLAWTNVVRPGEQIDRTVNLTQVPTAGVFSPTFGGPNRPTPLFQSSDLVVHTLRVGFQCRY